MGNPDSPPGHGARPGGENSDSALPPSWSAPPPQYPQTRPYERPPEGAEPGGYQLQYSPGGDSQHGDSRQGQWHTGQWHTGQWQGNYPGQQPPGSVPPGWPPPSQPGGGNKKALLIAIGAVAVVAIIAVAAIVVTRKDAGTATTNAAATTTRTTPATTSGSTAGALPGFPSDISIPPIMGGSTTGPNVKNWTVEVQGSGTAELSAVGIPDVPVFGSESLPWSKSFKSDSALVTITVLGYTGDASCKITRDGAVVDEQKSESEGALLLCTAFGSN